MRQIVVFSLLGYWPSLSFAQAATLPTCAQGCATNATTATGSCGAGDTACLCKNSNYLNTISCCISTTCEGADQQAAIKFNQQACAAVNVTLPNFVGCSPFGASGSALPSFNTATLTTPTTSGVSTVSTVEPAVTSFVGMKTMTGSFAGGSILTGACASPRFAAFTDDGGVVTKYPWVGCSHDFEDCCPSIDPHEPNVLKECPSDYTTTNRACCPSGWSIYYTALGPQAPCFTTATVTLVPPVGAETVEPSMSPIVMNNDIFTLKYDLVPSKTKNSNLGAGAAAGIAVGIFIIAVALATGLLFWLHRRRQARKPIVPAKPSVRERGISMPAPLTTTEIPTTAPPPYPERHELASPQSGTPGSDRGAWIVPPGNPQVPPVTPTSPLSYEETIPPLPLAPVEMPGDTWLNEHHPAFASGSGSGGEDGDLIASEEGPGVPLPLSRADSPRVVSVSGEGGQRVPGENVEHVSPASAISSARGTCLPLNSEKKPGEGA